MVETTARASLCSSATCVHGGLSNSSPCETSISMPSWRKIKQASAKKSAAIAAALGVDTTRASLRMRVGCTFAEAALHGAVSPATITLRATTAVVMALQTHGDTIDTR